MGRLLLLFIVVPAIELLLLIEIGKHIGALPTLGIIVATGALGAYLARHQGLGALARMRSESRAGRLPAESIFDGIMILIAGAVLITPGVLTDIFGFLLLVPAFRRLLRARMRRGFERAVREGRVHVAMGPGAFGGGGGPAAGFGASQGRHLDDDDRRGGDRGGDGPRIYDVPPS